MLTTTRILVDVKRQLAYVQMSSPEGEAVYEIDTRGGDVFERVHQAVTAVNRVIARRQDRSVEGILSEVAKML
jgi:hypothetical protein